MKFYDFRNIGVNGSADLYIYGEICLEKSEDYWTNKKNETDVDLIGFKEELDKLNNVKILNIFVNSPGGSVFVASTMINMLQRLKDNGVEINAYVDGLAASAASFFIMIANNIRLYKNSIVMIHKPICSTYGNSLELQSAIDMLNKIEDSTMIPMYMEKAKISEEQLKKLIEEESWFNAKEMEEYFDVELIDSSNSIVACVNKKVISQYKKVPKNLVIENKKTNENNKEDIIKNKIKLIRNYLFIRK